jgi:hypothetical protein
MFLSNESIRTIFQPDVDKLLSHVHHVLAAPSQINTAITFSIATKSPSATSLNLKKPSKDGHKKDNVASVFHTSYILTALHVLSSLLLLVQSSLSSESTILTLDDQDNHHERRDLVDDVYEEVASASPLNSGLGVKVFPHTIDNILFQNSFRRELLYGSRSSHVSLSSQCERLELMKSIESTLCSYWNLSTSNQSSISTSAHGETYQILSSISLMSIPLSAILMSYTNSTSITPSDQTSALHHHLHLYHSLFKSFPYQSEESLIAPSGSTLESESKKRIETLNMILCESSFVGYLRYLSLLRSAEEKEKEDHMENENRSQSDMREIINLSSEYLSSVVTAFSEKMKRQQNFFTGNHSSRLQSSASQKISLTRENDNNEDSDNEEHLSKRGVNGTVAGTGTGTGAPLSESLLRIFRCLSYQSNYMIRCSKQNIGLNFFSQFTILLNQFSTLLNQFLSLLNNFTDSLLKQKKGREGVRGRGRDGGRGRGQGRDNINTKEILQLLYSIERVLICNWKMIREDELWDVVGEIDPMMVTFIEGRNQSLLSLLQNICQIPTVVCQWMSSQGDDDEEQSQESKISDLILRHVCNILLVIITRGGNMIKQGDDVGDDDDERSGNTLIFPSRQGSNNQWKYQLNQLICQTIDEIFQPTDDDTMTEASNPSLSLLPLYMKCHPNDRRHWFDVWSYCQYETSQQRNEILMNITDLLSEKVFSSEEQSYFLTLVYLKRYEYLPYDLISILIHSFEAHKITFLQHSLPSPHAIHSFQQWSQLISNLLYLCSPSTSHSLSILKMIQIPLELLLTIETDDDTAELNESSDVTSSSAASFFPMMTYFDSYLRYALLSNLLRKYRVNISTINLSPLLISHTVSNTSTEHQQLFLEFISLFVDSLVRHFTDDISSSSHSLLQVGWNQLKHTVMTTDTVGSSPIISNQWLLEIIQTQWSYPGDPSSTPIQVDLWEELLKRLGLEVYKWSEMSEERREELKVTERCLSLLSHLFEVVQYLKTIHCLTVERTQRMTEFLGVVKKNLNLTAQIEEFVVDLERYMT